jgi:Patatin-like phospholipase
MPYLNQMLKAIGEILESGYYSLPVQLLVMQVRYQKYVLACWVFFFLATTKNFGEMLGIPYLFLEPEYLGTVSFTSMFLIGCGMGTFITSYMISTYISESYRFHFLAMEKRPFLVFYLNNLLLPIAFVVVYTTSFIEFQTYNLGHFEWEIIGELMGAFAGLAAVTLFIILNFFRKNRTFVQVIGEKAARKMASRRVIIEKARAGMGIKIRVDYYLTGFFKLGSPDPNEPAEFRKLVKVLNQNHGKALFLEFILLAVIVGLGLLEQNAAFQIPAGASIFFLFSILLMLVSAIIFWFRKLGPLAMLAIVLVFLVFDNVQFFQNKHPALGMNYEIKPADYTLEHLVNTSTEQNIRADIANTTAMLERWLADYRAFHGPTAKPKAILICTSGGGLRSAYFTTRIMQRLDSLTGGQFMDQTRLITGASGGMVGAAYYRELYLLKKLGQIEDIWLPEYNRRIARDLLNRTILKIVSSLFLPTAKEWVGGSKYDSDRGWSFDNQLVANLGVFKDRRLGEYVSLEEGAFIPQMIFSPVVINDGRRLYVSAIPATYLTRSYNFDGSLERGVSGIDFRRFFKDQDADSLLFVTALRMNASFPMITPYIRLPSEPPMELIDAGVADNYGLETASRYLRHFANWYRENTSGLMLLQIRDSRLQSMDLPKYHNKNFVKQLLDPIGSTYSAYYMSNDLSTEQYIHAMDAMMVGDLEYASFQYEPTDTGGVRASLSWHLTPHEVQNIEESLDGPDNKALLDRVTRWLQGEEFDLPARDSIAPLLR